MIKAEIDAKGVIEKPDVIGAVFGQTEGLLGPDLDLRELQKTGRIGRIEVNIKSSGGKSKGEITIPSSLDSAETSLIAATLETIERVGPCSAKITLKLVEDTREKKRKYVVDKAKEILKSLMEKGIEDSSKISEGIKEEIKTHEITTYHGLPCGPNLLDSDEIIIVEGRADVVALVKYGVKNVIAMEGSSVPQAIINLSKEKTVTAFLDDDRGGTLNLKALMETIDLDYVTRATDGKEVEELSKKEVYKALRSKTAPSQQKSSKGKPKGSRDKQKKENPGKDYRKSRGKRKFTKSPPKSRGFDKSRQTDTPGLSDKEKDILKKTLDEIIGTRAACILDPLFNLLGKVPVKELENTLKTVDNPYAVVFDGKVDYKLENIAKRKGVKFLVGMEKDNIKSSVKILSKDDIKQA